MSSFILSSTSILSRTTSRTVFGTAHRFSTSYIQLNPVKPGSSSESTVPGGGSTEEVAHSSGAYSQESNPKESGAQIQKEKGDKVDMKHSAATSEASDLATKGAQGQGGTGSKSKRDDGISKQLPKSSGKTE